MRLLPTTFNLMITFVLASVVTGTAGPVEYRTADLMDAHLALFHRASAPRSAVTTLVVAPGLYPASVTMSAPEPACNRPAAEMPPAPDGCPEWAPIAPPDAPIPPSCITDFQVERWDEEDAGVTELIIYVDHPELGPGVQTYTRLARHGGGVWELTDADWEASCGKDEGPLVWALLEVLNAGQWDALSIYTAPLPAEYMAVLAELAGLRNFTYLPYLEVQP